MKKCNKEEIFQSNELSQKFCSTLSVYQYRFLYLLISHVKPYDTGFVTEYYTFHELCEILNLSHGGMQIKQIVQSLHEISKQTWYLYDGGKSTVMFIPWFSFCTVHLETGDVEVRLNDSLLPHFTQLKRCFTAFDFDIVLRYQSKYSVRLYILCKSWQSKKTFEITVPVLRNILNADVSSYRRFYTFKQNVLDIALAEINRESDITVDYTVNYENQNTISSLTFTIQKQESVLCETVKRIPKDE